jgi:hypothetical protein
MTRLERGELLSVLVAVRTRDLKFAESKLRELIHNAHAEHAAEDAADDALERIARGKLQ